MGMGRGDMQGGGFRLMAVDLTAGTTGLLFPPKRVPLILGGFLRAAGFEFCSVGSHEHLGM